MYIYGGVSLDLGGHTLSPKLASSIEVERKHTFQWKTFSHRATIMVAVNCQGHSQASILIPSGKREGRNLNAKYEYNTLSNPGVVEPYAAQPLSTSRIASTYLLQPLQYYLRRSG